MNNSNRLLELYMQKLSLETLNEAARKLSVTRPAVSNWKAGTSHPNAEAIAIMCKSTGENPAHWLPLIEADRARTIGDRNAWLKIAQAAAALAMIYLVTRHGVNSDAVSAFVLSPVYIMRNVALLAAVLLAALHAADLAANYRDNNARPME